MRIYQAVLEYWFFVKWSLFPYPLTIYAQLMLQYLSSFAAINQPSGRLHGDFKWKSENTHTGYHFLSLEWVYKTSFPDGFLYNSLPQEWSHFLSKSNIQECAKFRCRKNLIYKFKLSCLQICHEIFSFLNWNLLKNFRFPDKLLYNSLPQEGSLPSVEMKH